MAARRGNVPTGVIPSPSLFLYPIPAEPKEQGIRCAPHSNVPCVAPIFAYTSMATRRDFFSALVDFFVFFPLRGCAKIKRIGLDSLIPSLVFAHYASCIMLRALCFEHYPLRIILDALSFARIIPRASCNLMLRGKRRFLVILLALLPRLASGR